ncbi:MAG: hypothetical protein ACK54F_09240 [Planctomycetia bacterium]|jgi:hypothetical protein
MAGALWKALALLAVVGEEHPLDLRDADLRQGVEHARVAEVDEDRSGAILHDT